MHDLIILGAGPGGYVAAIRAAQLGLRVALVERDALGGVCLNRGCIPSKALITNAEVISLIRRAEEFGVTVEGIRLDFAKGVERSRGVVRRLQKGIEQLLKKHRVELIAGSGSLVARNRVRISGKGGDLDLQARNILIACGTRVKLPAGVRVDGSKIMTSDEALFLKSLPESMAILGAGYTGVEFAYVFSVYGVDVTLVELQPQILPTEDAEAASVIAKRYKRAGVKILTGTSVEQIRTEGRGVTVVVSGQGKRQEIQVDAVLAAMGRQTNLEGLGLEHVSVATDRGFVKTDERMRTTVPGIYAIGDIAGKALLAHSAMAEGISVAEAVAGRDVTAIDYRFVPRCTYCQPQLAAIGLTEEEARKRHPVKVGKFPFAANGKALALGEPEGFVKVIAEERTGEILGVHMVGAGVTELVSEISLARLLEASTDEIKRAIHPHPTLSEALMEAAAAAAGEAIHQ